MTALAKSCMNVDEYLVWSAGQPGRYELFRGEVFAMSPETVGHVETKGRVYAALATGIQRDRLPCFPLGDGATVRIDDTTAYQPDALVYCGEKLSPTALEIPRPIILVEVLSPSTHRVDVSLKLAGYFKLPSVAHYLIVDPMQPVIIHHRRATGDTILTKVITEGEIVLDPPGLTIALAAIYGA